MLDHPSNQAAGLLALTPAPRTRLIALVNHGDAAAELPLLLRMCSALVSLGFPVTVLDGTVRESEDNPGLEQMLDYSAPPAASTEGASWSVIPALSGLQMLSTGLGKSADPLLECGWLFPHDSVAIVYAPGGVLVQLFGGTPVRPVLAVSTGKSSLLTGYLALKRLVRKGKLSPMVVNFSENALPGDKSSALGSVGVGLQDYAKYFLNYDVTLFNVPPTRSNDVVDRAVERLTLGLLESAFQLAHKWAPTPHCTAAAFQPSTMLG